MKWFFKYAFFLQLAWYCSELSVIGQGQDLRQRFLAPHNSARAQLGVGPLVWDATVAAYAQNYANKRIADCAMQHSGGRYGENLFKSKGYSDPVATGVMSWVNEKQYYDYNSNSCAGGQVCGHYTQVVWRDSKKLGCAQVQCNDGWTFVICSYDPPGNYAGQRPYWTPFHDHPDIYIYFPSCNIPSVFFRNAVALHHRLMIIVIK